MLDTNACAFARQHPADADVFVSALTEDCVLQFRVSTGAAHLAQKGKEGQTCVWRLNDNPNGSKPSAWMDFAGHSFALWYDHERQFYSVKLQENAAAKVKILV